MQYSANLDCHRLAVLYPPKWESRRKEAIHNDVRDRSDAGHMRVSRWSGTASRPRPDSLRGPTQVQIQPGFYRYDAVTVGTHAWHVNFADEELFGYYGTDLFAQDEVQVLEHPALGSAREYLLTKALQQGCLTAKCYPSLVDERGAPTPWLFQGVPRVLSVDTAQLYGNAFAGATSEQLRGAITVGVGGQSSNIVCIAAPRKKHSTKHYTAEVLAAAYDMALAGFSAVAAATPQGTEVVVVTGHWGCGAFGGDRFVMAVVQILAASAAGLDRLVYCAADKDGYQTVCMAREFVAKSRPNVLEALLATKPCWRAGNGT